LSYELVVDLLPLVPSTNEGGHCSQQTNISILNRDDVETRGGDHKINSVLDDTHNGLVTISRVLGDLLLVVVRLLGSSELRLRLVELVYIQHDSKEQGNQPETSGGRLGTGRVDILPDPRGIKLKKRKIQTNTF